jgi:hypothetical protein
MRTVNEICVWLLKKSNTANVSFLIALSVLAITQKLNSTPIIVYLIALLGLFLLAHAITRLMGGAPQPNKTPLTETVKGFFRSFGRGIPLYFVSLVIILEADQMSRAWFGKEFSIPTLLVAWMGIIAAADMFKENYFSPE